MAKKQTEKNLSLYWRYLERKDIPKVIAWFCTNNYLVSLLPEYPVKNQQLFKNQLLKELALNKFTTASKQILVAEVNGEVMVAFAFLKNIDWRSRHLDLFFHIAPEIIKTDIALQIMHKLYLYIFQELNMHKIYEYVLDLDQSRIKSYQERQRLPEVVLSDYLMIGSEYHDLYIYSLFQREVLKPVVKKK